MKKSKESNECVDCNANIFTDEKDYYMVENHIWKQYGVGDNVLCIGCLESRMGRKLKFEDLTLCLLNIVNPYTRNIIKKQIRDFENFLKNKNLNSKRPIKKTKQRQKVQS